VFESLNNVVVIGCFAGQGLSSGPYKVLHSCYGLKRKFRARGAKQLARILLIILYEEAHLSCIDRVAILSDNYRFTFPGTIPQRALGGWLNWLRYYDKRADRK